MYPLRVSKRTDTRRVAGVHKPEALLHVPDAVLQRLEASTLAGAAISDRRTLSQSNTRPHSPYPQWLGTPTPTTHPPSSSTRRDLTCTSCQKGRLLTSR